MPAALPALSRPKKTGRPSEAQPALPQARARARAVPETDPGGLPRFLQRKCAACAAGGTSCPGCEEEEKRVQMAGGAVAPPRAAGPQLHAAARAGVHGAGEPLPHLGRVQAAFGRHDVSQARARTGGSAAAASTRMGAEAYTVGNRVGFKGAPDVGLAAHEAAHVVQQRQGVSLKDGVGRPGDPYERQADEVAAAVTQGRSAEGILDRGPDGGGGSSAARGPGATPVQHRLEVNALRQFEPPSPTAEAGPRGGGGRRSGGADRGAGGGEAKAAAPAEAPALDHAGEAAGPVEGALEKATATEPADAGAGPDAGAGAGGGEAEADQKTCPGAGTLNASCYNEDIEEPAEEPEEQPPEPEPTEAEEQMQSDSPEAEEVDDCPVETAIAQQGPPPETAVAAGAGSELTSPPSAAGTATAGGEAAPAEAPPSAAGPGGAAERTPAGGGGGEEDGAAAEAPSPMDAAISGVEGQRGAALAAFARASAGLDAVGPGVAALHAGARFAPQPGESRGDTARRHEAEARASGLFTLAAGRMDDALHLAGTVAPDRLGNLAESLKAALALSVESQKQSISARIGGARAAAFASAEAARGVVGSEHEATLVLIEAQTAAASDTLTAAHEESLGAVDDLETATLDAVNATYTRSREVHEALGPTMAAKAVARGEEYVAEYHKCRIDRKDSFFAGYLTDRRAEAQKNAARETAKGYDKSLRDAASKQAREAMKGRKKDRCGIIATARSARGTLDAQFAQFQAAIESGRQQAITQAEAARDQTVSAIESALGATLTQLAAQEHRQRQAANDTGYLQQVAIEQAAHAAAASILQTVGEAVGAVQGTLTQVQTTFADSPAPDPETLDGLLNQATSAVESGLGRLVGQVEIGLGASEERLQAAGAQGMTALDGVTSANDAQASALSGGFAGRMGALAEGASRTFGQMQSGYAQGTQNIVTAATAALDQAVTGGETACATALTAVETQLAQSAQFLEGSLQESLDGLDCETTGIPKQAWEAASHEAPAWKSIVKWVLIIAIIVVVALVAGPAVIGAVGAAAASLGAGAAAAAIGTIVGGAIVGAATSATIQVLNNWETNQSLTKGVGRAAIMGAIGGAFGAGAGALIGKYAAGTVAQVALNVAADTVLEVGTQVVTGEFSWENLGMAVLMSAVTGGFGEVRGIKGIQARSMARGARAVPGAGAKAHAASLTPPKVEKPAPAPRAGEVTPEPRPTAAAAEPTPAPRPAEPALSAPKGVEETPSAPRSAEGEVEAPPGAATRPGEPAPAAVRPPEAPARKAHLDRPEVEPGVVAKQTTPDGHEVKVLRDGRVMVCTDCAELRIRYAEDLAANPALRQKLDEIEALADPALKDTRATELRAELESARLAKATAAATPEAPKAVPEAIPTARPPGPPEAPATPGASKSEPEPVPTAPGAAGSPAPQPKTPPEVASERLQQLKEQRAALEDRVNDAKNERSRAESDMKRAASEENAAPDGPAKQEARKKALEAKKRFQEAQAKLQEIDDEGVKLDIKDLDAAIAVESIKADPKSRATLPCFAAETAVLTPHGPRPIASFRPGEMVWAYDFSTGTRQARPVLQLHRHRTRSFHHVRTDQGNVRATSQHRFWIETEAAWRPAAELSPGMRLRTFGGGKLEISETLVEKELEEATFNLSIEEFPTYFVGPGVLVHNAAVDVGLGGGYVIYRATNKKYPGKVYVGQTTELDRKGKPRGTEERQGEHQDTARKKLAQDASGVEKLSPADRAFYEFMSEAELEPAVKGIATKAQADYLEQHNIDIERKLAGENNVMNRREQIASESHLKAVEAAIKADPAVKALGYCP